MSTPAVEGAAAAGALGFGAAAAGAASPVPTCFFAQELIIKIVPHANAKTTKTIINFLITLSTSFKILVFFAKLFPSKYHNITLQILHFKTLIPLILFFLPPLFYPE